LSPHTAHPIVYWSDNLPVELCSGNTLPGRAFDANLTSDRIYWPDH
jgi:hypothetical protein